MEFPWLASLPPPNHTKPLFCSINVILIELDVVVGELIGTEPWDYGQEQLK